MHFLKPSEKNNLLGEKAVERLGNNRNIEYIKVSILSFRKGDTLVN